jgi:hypothetical protein
VNESCHNLRGTKSFLALKIEGTVDHCDGSRESNVGIAVDLLRDKIKERAMESLLKTGDHISIVSHGHRMNLVETLIPKTECGNDVFNRGAIFSSGELVHLVLDGIGVAIRIGRINASEVIEDSKDFVAIIHPVVTKDGGQR